jgi:hypothetical protein
MKRASTLKALANRDGILVNAFSVVDQWCCFPRLSQAPTVGLELANAFGVQAGEMANAFGVQAGEMANAFGVQAGEMANAFGVQAGETANAFGVQGRAEA